MSRDGRAGENIVADDDPKFTRSLSESVLTLLCFGGERGQVASGMVDARWWEPPYDDIAKRAIEYRQRYKQAPGKEHIDDLFDHVVSDPGNKRAPLYRRILVALYRQSEGLKEEYVLDRVNEFHRRQSFKRAVIKAGRRYEQGGDGVADDVEAILAEAMRVRSETLDPGTFANDPVRALRFLDQSDHDTLPLHIPRLDGLGIGPTRKEAFVFMGPRGSGKSMFLTHVSVCALLHHWRVLDISLEMSEELKVQRLYQNMFAVAKRDEEWMQAVLRLDNQDRLAQIAMESRSPERSLHDGDIRAYLQGQVQDWGAQLGNYVTRRFPTRQLSYRKLVAFLDYLEQAHGFVPDALLIDYPWLMEYNDEDRRMSFGSLFENLRGLCVERGMAGVFPHQGNRGAESAKEVRGFHASEDISILATADQMLTYSRTEAEKRRGLARLHAAKTRNDLDGFSVLLQQSYRTAHFVHQSVHQSREYWGMLESLAGQEAAAEAEADAESAAESAQRLRDQSEAARKQ